MMPDADGAEARGRRAPAPWAALGFTPGPAGVTLRVGTTMLRFGPERGGGCSRWAFAEPLRGHARRAPHAPRRARRRARRPRTRTAPPGSITSSSPRPISPAPTRPSPPRASTAGGSGRPARSASPSTAWARSSSSSSGRPSPRRRRPREASGASSRSCPTSTRSPPVSASSPRHPARRRAARPAHRHGAAGRPAPASASPS